MSRILEVIFRHPLQLLLIILLLPIIGVATAYFVEPHLYQSTASLWALRHYEIIGDSSTLVPNPPPTPAESQATALTELLQTRDFALSVANAANLPSTFDTDVQAVSQLRDDTMFAEISTHVLVQPQSYNLFLITYANRNPQVAQAVVSAVIQNFGLRSVAFSLAQGQNLLENYQAQLAIAEQNADSTAEAEAAYVSAHPELYKEILLAGAEYAQLIDPKYALLHTQTAQAQSTMQNIQNQIASTQLQISSLGSSADNLFKVIDTPIVSSRPESRTKNFLIAGAMGLGIALLACSLYIIILFRGDRTLYTILELQQVTTHPVIIQLPQLAPRTVQQLVKQSKLNVTQSEKVRSTQKSH